MTDFGADPVRSRWPHFIAVVLVCATFPLIWVGGLVTTYDAGMAVPDWPTTYGYNMFLYPISTWLSAPWDLFIEHGHRLLGALAGVLTIALNITIWKYDSRQWMRWVGAAALLLVISQGLLGGMRVRMNSTDLARIHGCTGPLFFAVSVAICVMTSKFWCQPLPDGDGSFTSRRPIVAGWGLVGLSYAQLVLGSHLRHPNLQWSPAQFRTFVLFHVAVAALLVIQACRVAYQSRRQPFVLRRPALLLVVLMLGQILLGVATWRAKYGWPSFIPLVAEAEADRPYEIALHNSLAGRTIQSESMSQAMTVTGHVALGSLILAMSVLYATRLTRQQVVLGRKRADRDPAGRESFINSALSSSLAGGTVS